MGEPSGIVRLSDLLPAESRGGVSDGPISDPSVRKASNDGASGSARIRHRDEAEHPPLRRSSRGARSGHGGADDRLPANESRPYVEGDVSGPAPSSVDHVPDGPAWESLFGPDANSRTRKRRERPPATAMQRALGLLTRREHSRKELTRKLVSRGVDAAEVEAAVDKLAGAGWQDERRFAENLVRARAAAGYGPLHIRAELATHDLPADVRDAAFEAFDGDWSAIAVDLVRRRFSRIEDVRLRERKAADFLVRRGFPGDVVRSASRSIPDGD